MSVQRVSFSHRCVVVDRLSIDADDDVPFAQAFDIAAKELGISPPFTGEDILRWETPDKLSVVSYLSQFYELFRAEDIRPKKRQSKNIHFYMLAFPQALALISAPAEKKKNCLI